MKTLTHGQRIIVNGKKMTVGTQNGYGKELKRMINAPYEPPWTVAEPVCITNSPGYYEREEKKWSGATVIEDGEKVRFDDEPGIFVVKFMGDYSDPVHFRKEE